MEKRKTVKSFELGSKEASMFMNGDWQTAACQTQEEDFGERVRKPRVSEKTLILVGGIRKKTIERKGEVTFLESELREVGRLSSVFMPYTL